MRRVLIILSSSIFLVAQFAANTPSQLGQFQLKAPNKLNKQ